MNAVQISIKRLDSPECIKNKTMRANCKAVTWSFWWRRQHRRSGGPAGNLERTQKGGRNSIAKHAVDKLLIQRQSSDPNNGPISIFPPTHSIFTLICTQWYGRTESRRDGYCSSIRFINEQDRYSALLRLFRELNHPVCQKIQQEHNMAWSK